MGLVDGSWHKPGGYSLSGMPGNMLHVVGGSV